MSFPPPRPPTKAETKVSPLIEQTEGSLYPYWDLQTSGLTPYLNVIRRSHQQVPTSERMGVGIRRGPTYYIDQPYPHGIHFNSWYPSHFNPFSSPQWKSTSNITHAVPPGFKFKIGINSIAPRFCARTIQTYKRCLMTNDDKEEVCKEEQDNIISICPNFVLDTMKDNKLLALKLEAMANKKYHNVMTVPSYNKGRTVADVPHRSWEDGNRHNLRGNTLWADDRYADVTPEEVQAAKERMKQRREAQNVQLEGLPKYDRTYEAPSTKIPLYSV